MSDLVWWTLFAVLVLCLAIFTVKLVYRVISDLCFEDDKDVYSEDNTGVEDLTRYRNDFRTIYKDVQVQDESDRWMMTKEFVPPKRQNEVDCRPTVTDNDRLVMTKEFVSFKPQDEVSDNDQLVMTKEFVSFKPQDEDSDNDQLQVMTKEFVSFKPQDEDSENEQLVVTKESEDEVGNKPVITITSESGTEENKVGEEKDEAKRDEVDASKPEQKNVINEPESFSKEEREALERILGIEGEVDIYAKQIPYCLGGKNHLQYFEINQKFLMNLIGLSAIDCKDNDKLKKRKQVVSLYINECQKELKKKADEVVV